MHPNIEHLHDMGKAQPRQRAGFPAKSRQMGCVTQSALHRELDGDGGVEVSVPSLPDLAHPTLPNETDQLIALGDESMR